VEVNGLKNALVRTSVPSVVRAMIGEVGYGHATGGGAMMSTMVQILGWQTSREERDAMAGSVAVYCDALGLCQFCYCFLFFKIFLCLFTGCVCVLVCVLNCIILSCCRYGVIKHNNNNNNNKTGETREGSFLFSG